MIHELLSLTLREASILKNELQESEGEVLFFIHPFQLEIMASRKKLEKMPFKMISKFIELFKQDEEMSPVIIFEDIRLYQWTTKLIEAFLSKKDRAVYLVPTPPTFPIPSYSKPPISKRAEDRYCRQYEKPYWERFLEYISDAGVRQVLLGGTSLELYELTGEGRNHERHLFYKSYYEQRKLKGAKNLNYFPARCVGTAAAWLSTTFDVEITILALPHNRAHLLYLEELEPVSTT